MQPLTRRTILGASVVPFFLSRGYAAARPNILFAIADDQSWPHTGANGDRTVRTPSFDRVAGVGVRFTNAICASPGCAPSRAAILTGRYPWQLGEAGTHASGFPTSLTVYPDLLERAGYFVGLTGKGAGPCNWQGSGWKRNPAGPDFSSITVKNARPGVSNIDYAANFAAFLDRRPKGTPFAFWFGCQEPHRDYEEGSGLKSGRRLDDVKVPPFLPDAPEVRSDLLDYYLEIEHFDTHLGRMLDLLEKRGELSNTIVVVTSDNGMAFPAAKAMMTDYGIHLPLAIAWPERWKGGRVYDDVISFVDFAPTFLEAAGIPVPATMVGESLIGKLDGKATGRIGVFSGRERHSHARFDNLGYPARAYRTRDYLYVRNFKPDRWPAGDPEGYYDIDAGPTKTYVQKHREDPKVRPFFERGFGKQPAEQLFDIRKDPGCLNNLAGKPEFQQTQAEMRRRLEAGLKAHEDPRMLGTGDIFESYPRYSLMRPELGGFAERGKYNPKYQRR